MLKKFMGLQKATESPGGESSENGAPSSIPPEAEPQEKGANAEGGGEEAGGEPVMEIDETTELPASENLNSGRSTPSDLDAARSESRENFDKYVRAVAELENFRKRTAKERADLIRYAGESLAYDILDVVDDLERALAQPPGGGEEFSRGVKLIYDRFISILERHQIRGESALGSTFDPAKQEALASVPTADEPPGSVLNEFRKSYMFKDKLLRPGQVVVAVSPPAPAEPSSAESPAETEETR